MMFLILFIMLFLLYVMYYIYNNVYGMMILMVNTLIGICLSYYFSKTFWYSGLLSLVIVSGLFLVMVYIISIDEVSNYISSLKTYTFDMSTVFLTLSVMSLLGFFGNYFLKNFYLALESFNYQNLKAYNLHTLESINYIDLLSMTLMIFLLLGLIILFIRNIYSNHSSTRKFY